MLMTSVSMQLLSNLFCYVFPRHSNLIFTLAYPISSVDPAAQHFYHEKKQSSSTLTSVTPEVEDALKSLNSILVVDTIISVVKVNGQNVKEVVIHDGGSFVNVDGLKWAQFDSKGNELFIFSQLFRDEWSVYLKDEHERSDADGSKMVLQVDLHSKKVFWCNRDGL
uniref:Uncharacterized protein n=1 Tax=Skeletonema marinoi TaxID=267567 RepID=A0A7S2LJD5_9STRA|mmetsp:Transcript_2579/g.4163  ORF Transcript_2579/g.4163 Transcript_2579/m.4163 type:complete len:166 (+) Transcript_2579:175-672(+)